MPHHHPMLSGKKNRAPRPTFSWYDLFCIELTETERGAASALLRKAAETGDADGVDAEERLRHVEKEQAPATKAVEGPAIQVREIVEDAQRAAAVVSEFILGKCEM